MLKKIISTLGIIIFLYITISISSVYVGFLKKRNIKNQISYLDNILSNGYDDELQLRYPEGKIFSNALLALSIIDNSNNTLTSHLEYAKIVDNCLERLLTESAQQPFSKEMVPRYGAFYNGWINFTLSKYIKSDLFELSANKNEFLNSHQKISEEIIKAHGDSIKILDTYPGVYWPADNLVGIISVNDETLKDKWVDKLYEECTTESKLLHHTGYNTSEVRGSSQALLLYLLSEYDIEKASVDNRLFKNILVDNYIGIELVKEFTKGRGIYPDVDSGPVLLGYGAVGTVMNVKLQAKLNNSKSKATWAFLNTISLPINLFGQKYYLLKKEPMFDIFMLWCSVEL